MFNNKKITRKLLTRSSAGKHYKQSQKYVRAAHFKTLASLAPRQRG